MAVDRVLDLGDQERLARHLVERLCIDQELVAEHRLELPGVHFRHEDGVVTLEQRTKIRRHRPDVADVDVRDVTALGARTADSLMNRPEGRTPTDDHQLARGLAEFDGLVGHRDVRHLVAADFGHLLMVFGTVIDVPGADRLLDPADAVEQAGRAGLDPRTLQILVARIRQEATLGHFFEILDRERRIARHVGDEPRLGRIGDIAIGQQHHRSHILDRDPHRLDRYVEAIRRRTCRKHRDRRIAVTAIDRLIQIRLLGLGRQAGRGTAALRVDDDERELGHDRKPHRFALERDARARRGSDAELSRVRRADRGSDRGDLIFRLERGDAVFLEARQEVQDRRCGRDRIAAEEHRYVRKLDARDQAHRDRLGASHRTVQARCGRCDADVMLLHRTRQLGGFAIGVACVQRGNVRLGEHRSFGELGLEPVDDRRAIPIEHPECEPQRPHVLAAQRLLVAKPERLHRIQRQLRDVEAQQLPLGEAAIGQRIGSIFRLGEVAFAELAFVRDDQAAGLQRRRIHLQRRRVHRDQHVGRVTRGFDRSRAEVDLERGHTEQRALRRADFGGKIREGREIVA